MSTNALQVLAEEMAAVFYPIRHLNSAEQLTTFFRDLGYELPGNQLFGELPVLIQLTNELVTAVTELASASGDDAILQALAKVLEALAKLVAEIASSIDAIKASVAAVPNFIANSDIDEFPVRLVDYLLSFYLWRSRRKVYGVMLFIGVLDEVDMPADAAKFQPAFKLRKVWWDRLPKFLSEPQNLPEIVYQWESNFRSELFLTRLYILFNSFNLPGGLYKQSASVKAALGNTTDGLQELRMPIFTKNIYPSTRSEFDLNATPVEQSGPEKPGFALIPYIYGEAGFDFDIDDKIEILFDASASVDAGIGLIFRPDSGIRFLDNLFSTPSDSINVGLSLEVKQKEGTGEIILVGNPDATRLAIEGPRGKVFVIKTSEIDAGIELGLDALRLVVKGGDGDGFLSTILGDDGITAEAGFGFGLSKQGGMYFTGSGGLEIQLPAHIELGTLEIQGLLIALKLREGNFVLEGGANFKLELGPLVGVVENTGISATLSFPENGGNLGPANLAFGFKPPNGVGLSIDAGVVKGGGYLFFDFDKEEYAGALELEVVGFLTLKAIGLITTKMPDGNKGFSLLIIITAEFGTPIQLGFGFTLSGVGGLVGLNRTMLLQPLAEGVRSGAINSIMFPTDVVANAPRIISDLRSFFPPEEGIFLIGPMAKLGWGTPNLITLSLGIIIEIPGNIAIVGVLKVALPDEDAALLVLQVNFIGAIEFDKSRAWFFASLFESRVLFITIEGEMGILIGWGEDANFVVSVGGFHPAFNPPPLPFPSPRRIALDILNTPYARIRVEGYFAVTSNTVQFGAAVELFFGISAFNIDGHLAFDALFQFSPFYFIITISASLSVKVFGVGLFSVRMRGKLEGPTPWHVEGTGSISLLFFDIDVDFSHTWGDEVETILPPIPVMPLLKGEFEKQENWRSLIPDSNRLLVSLRTIDSSADLVLHPVGALKISQRAVPLDLTLDKVGAQKPGDANYFTLSVTSGGLQQKSEAEESFAIAQFKEMDNSQKLSSPPFEPMQGGMELSVSGNTLDTSLGVKRVVRYESIIIDNNYKRFVRKFLNFIPALFGLFLNGGAVTKSELSFAAKKQKGLMNEKIEIKPNSYAVAFNDNNVAMSGAVNFSSYAKAQEYMNAQIKNDRTLHGNVHVIPSAELQEAA
ncbi:DUF6603 domain-containing protein [Nitrosomonas sp. Nm166]|uniref:DUF6603 domain-containing protein n=1 Tax=Nitrosomonas sp. Nm166 TaxID=1881054 RepID=UPI0008EC021C|nr:DUF6603 domain-containing protein [Nitrosomonas sp. Nm166]SFF10794.1 hypothetical protein SAMN05428977_10513 [Nitrosomonas sp. Nm166]